MLKQVMEIFDLLDRANINGHRVAEFFLARGADKADVTELRGDGGKTDFIKICVNGTQGKTHGGKARTISITGRLGGLGARPGKIGFVSDGDGALAALAAALKLVDMAQRGDRLAGDTIITTHICPDAPTIDHYPVMLMNSPIDTNMINLLEVNDDIDAVLSLDTTKGNKIINCRGFAISPTVKEGYILKVSDDLLDIMSRVTGRLPVAFAVSQQDITPYGNGLYHMNSIMQPAVATCVPVVGVAITTETVVAGCATGATHEIDVSEAARFAVEVAKDYTAGQCSFYDEEEFTRITGLYGDMRHFQLEK